MVNHTALRPEGMPRPGGFRADGLRGLRDALILKLTALATRSVVDGQITLTLPSGRTATIGRGTHGAHANLTLHSFAVFWTSLRRGTLGFAECYLDGSISTTDLAELFRFFIDNKANLDSAGRGWFRVRAPDLAFHIGNRNTRDGSRRNIAAHYDLGNSFYELWLDPSMTYSSACFVDADQPLEAAQHEKNARVLRALDVQPGMRLLEIGCGWGGFVEQSARAGLDVTGVTVSAEQFDYSGQRIAAAGLDHTAKINFEDYRDITGEFDRIASIEMIEAVGAEHWRDYFRVLHDRLKPGGIAVIQAITIREASWQAYSSKADFIQRYIFPGGMLPTKTHLAEHAAESGLTFETIETFAGDYARTLALWRDRVNETRHRIEALGFDQKFLRMWDYYLTYCEAGFERGVIDVGHYRFAKPATLTPRTNERQPALAY